MNHDSHWGRFTTIILLAILFTGGNQMSANAGLVAHWSFNGNADDETGNYNGTAIGGISFDWDDTLGREVAVFDSSQQGKISVPAVDAMYAGSYTFATWVRVDDLSGGGQPQLFGDWGANGTDLTNCNFRFFYNGKFITQYRTTGGEWPTIQADFSVSENQWYHFAAVLDVAGNSFKTYINGQLVDQDTAGFSNFSASRRKDFNTSPPLNHFGWKQDANDYLNGRMADAYILNNAISAGQLNNLIQYNMLRDPNRFLLNQLFGTGPTGPAVDYSFLDNTGAVPSASDLGIAKVQQGGMTGNVELTSGGLKFNAAALGPCSGSDQHGQIRSNECSNNGHVNLLYGGLYEGAFGMHSDAMVTFDLAEIRLANGWTDDMTFQFSATAGAAHALDGGNGVHSLVLLSSETEVLQAFVGGQRVDVVDLGGGNWTLDFGTGDISSILDSLLLNTNHSANIFAEFGAEADYLSLFILGNGSYDFDHGAYFNPLLTAIPHDENGSDVPEPATWGILLAGLAAMGIFRRKIMK